jgi:hypothetical protein
MPRKQPIKKVLPLKEATAPAPSLDEPVYRALLKEESDAYSAWFFYSAAPNGEAKEHLSGLRRRYEQKKKERLAYQSPESAPPEA